MIRKKKRKKGNLIMHSLRNALAGAVLGTALFACGAPSDPSASSSDALQRGPILNPNNLCAAGPQTQVVWTSLLGTLNGSLDYYPTPTTVGEYETFAGVDGEGNVDLIVWVSLSDLPAFNLENEVCYAAKSGLIGGSKPPAPPPGPTTRCPPPVPMPGTAPCVTIVQVANFASDRACTTPTYVAPDNFCTVTM